MLPIVWGPRETNHQHSNTAEASDWRRILPPPKPKRHRTVQVLQMFKHPIAEMLGRLANKPAGQRLECCDGFAVVKAGSQIIVGGR